MKRVIIVYNSRSSKAKQVCEEVIRPMQKKAGMLVGKFGVERTNLVENAKKLAKVLVDGDTVVAAGGDGTMSIALNGILLSGKKAKMQALSYGNFNDVARSWKDKEDKKWYPLEIKVNGEHLWWAGGYFSMGMFARSTKVFDDGIERKKLQEKRGRLVYSVTTLAKWYFKHKREEFLPVGKLNEKEWDIKMTDYLAINTESVAKVMKTNGFGLERKVFYRSSGKLQSFWRLMRYMLRSMIAKMPGEEAQNDIIVFDNLAKVSVQTDGECWNLEGVKSIEIKKADFWVQIAKKVW